MELLYAYIKSYKNINEQEIYFSNKYDIHYNQNRGNLKIEKNEEYINFFKYEEKVINISAIVGRNGVGKTNILNMISSIRGNLEQAQDEGFSFFLIYHCNNNMFFAEGVNTELFSNFFGQTKLNSFCCELEVIDKKIEKVNFLKNDEGRDKYKDFSLVEIVTENLNTNRRSSLYKQKIDFQNLKISRAFQDYHYLNRLYLNNGFDNFLKIYRTLIEADGGGYFKAQLFPELELIVEETTEKEITTIFGASSLIPITQEDIKKLTHKQQFIINILYSINISLLYEFIDNTEEEWEEIVVKTNQSIKLDNNKDIFSMYTEYYLKIYSSLIPQIVKLIKEENKNHQHFSPHRIDYFEYYERLNSYMPEFLSSNKQHLNVLYSSLLDLPDTYFSDGQKLRLIGKNSNADFHIKSSIFNLLDILDKIQLVPFWGLLEKVHYDLKHLSAGEIKLLKLISCIYEVPNKEINNLILLLDEPDNSLHPEWCRRFINDLIRLLGSINSIKNFQAIITTHSPFILSDLPKSNVIALKKDENGKSILENVKNKTFANHIHSLLSQDFFMDSTIGEYARTKINSIISFPKNDLVGIEDRYLYNLQFINLIGDDLLRNKLHQVYNSSEYLFYTKELKRKSIENTIRKLLYELEVMDRDEE
ncbi:AAA family ATPase [Peribacillus sp. NPDC101481]|uniref:AAA family ATPase n=1 Tax=Peribacillus sp. NPDC101481 TaxID=3364403 RepID=UPI003810E747